MTDEKWTSNKTPNLRAAVGKYAAGTDLARGHGIPVLLATLAIGQMDAHLVFFYTFPEAPKIQTILALASGVFVVSLVVFGSIIIMAKLDANMMPPERLLQMQR